MEYTINGKPISEAEFKAKKEEVKNMPGTKLVEITPNNFKLRIKG